MCGIIGYVGKKPAKDILIDGLAKLEYRGYDSAGIALLNDDDTLTIKKKAGRVDDLREMCSDDSPVYKSTCGIGHTRWATHGGVTDVNAHPHKCGNVALIHNGIIENYNDIIREYGLADKLVSETDTEVVAALLDTLYEGDPIDAIRRAVRAIAGSFALCIMFADRPGKIYAVRNVSPMIASFTENGAIIASEFRYKEPLINEKTLVIVTSQSGETIDTLEALRLAKRCGSKVLSVVNVKGSTIARESDYVLYTHAGPEIAVASTKAYSVQMAAMYLIGCRIGYVKGIYSEDRAREFIRQLLDVIPVIEETLKQADEVKTVANYIKMAPDAFFIGRGLDYTLSLEGALKLKEISYVHAEAYAAGELKHGTIALITDNVPVIALATQESVYGKMISNIREVKARGAYVILVSMDEEYNDRDVCDKHISIPKQDGLFTVFSAAVILQLIAYYTSDAKGLDVDKPRNLAKSVTVE